MTFSPRLLLSAVLDIYTLAVFAYILFSWLPPEHRRYRIYAFLDSICEPLLSPFRKLLPPVGGFDFSPIVAVVLLRFVAGLLLRHVPA